MPVVGNILEFKDFQAMSGIAGDILNVYHFQVDFIDTAIGLSQLGPLLTEDFYLTWIPFILAVQSSSLQHVRLEINNLNNYVSDFYVGSPAALSQGYVGSEFNASQVAWSFELVRTTRTTRNGSKRIAGVPEQSVANGVATAGALTLLNVAAVNLASQWVYEYSAGNSIGLSPVIIRRGISPSQVPALVNSVSDVVYRGVGSQNTRKQLLS